MPAAAAAAADTILLKSPDSSRSADTGLVVSSEEEPAPEDREKGGVRGAGEFQELPREDTPLDDGDIWPEEPSEMKIEL